MKIETSTPLRRDGTVIVSGLDGVSYVFKPDEESGMVVCDVDHEPTVAHLLRVGTFFPADEADHEKAAALIDLIQSPAGDDEDDGSDDDEDEEVDPNALPVEAGTPPAPRKKKAKAE
jgi:hypothetical protein